ncbi:putative beta-arrestin 1, partial [Danaus plexippus plexippus]
VRGARRNYGRRRQQQAASGHQGLQKELTKWKDGVVLIDPEYVKDRKVFGHVLAAFRYGREDLDVLGLTFRKDLYLAAEQIYPPTSSPKRPLTRLQERLVRKLGPAAHPFYFELPPHCPASVTLQPAPGDTGKPCGKTCSILHVLMSTSLDRPALYIVNAIEVSTEASRTDLMSQEVVEHST